MSELIQETQFLAQLKEQHFALNALPEELDITGFSEDGVAKPLLLATVDDLAFAKQILTAQIRTFSQKLEAVHHLHDLARECGAKGADYALDFIREHNGGNEQ